SCVFSHYALPCRFEATLRMLEARASADPGFDERIGIEECVADMARAFDLHGKVAVVTGAGSGIGRSTALLLARNGAKVHVADIDAERARKVVSEIEAAGGSASAHALDVSDAAAGEAFAEAVF